MAATNNQAYILDPSVETVIHTYRNDLPSTMVRAWQTQFPSPVKNAAFRTQILNNLPSSVMKLRMEDSALIEQFCQVIKPALVLYNRSNAYEIILVRHKTPLVMSDSGVVLLLTTGVIKRAESDDELIGLIAHEIAHEMFARRSVDAKTRYRVFRENGQTAFADQELFKLRQIELECDAFASITLAALGYNPHELARSTRQTGLEYKTYSDSRHPADGDRVQVIAGVVPSDALRRPPHRSDAFKKLKLMVGTLKDN